MLTRWEKCRDFYEGADAVKAKGTTYLPAAGSHEEDSKKYNAYKTRALFFNGTRRTVLGLGGAVFQKSPSVVVPGHMESDITDITLTGVSLDLFALYSTREVLITGRYGIFVDMAERPYWTGYQAEAIISWNAERRDGREVLTRVILSEVREVPNPKDIFAFIEIECFRVLSLIDNVYTQTLWYKTSDGDWAPEADVIPLRRGEPLDFIPFTFMSSDSVSSRIERPPLEDVVDVNMSHYHSMADLEWGRHFVALPTPWVSGLVGKDQEKLAIGSGVAWQLAEGGRAGMLEFTGRGLGALEKADVQKRHMMAALGARLLEDQPNQPETLGAVQIRHAGEHATLRTMTQVIGQGLTAALKWHAWWTGTEDSPLEVEEVSIALNKDFINVKASSEEIKTLLLAWQADAISYETFYEGLQSGEWARPGVTAEEEQDDIDKKLSLIPGSEKEEEEEEEEEEE